MTTPPGITVPELVATGVTNLAQLAFAAWIVKCFRDYLIKRLELHGPMFPPKPEEHI